MGSYWNSEKFDNRDEFLVILNAYFALADSLKRITPHNDWRLKFDVAYLFQLKSTAQASLAINLLTQSYCYADALVVCRTMISKANLLVLCALNPNLVNEWLKNPKDERFLDGHIREELTNNGIYTIPHLYEHASEIIHGHARALSDVGYFNEGLFSEIPAINNQVYVIAKFIIAVSYQTMISMALQDCVGKRVSDELEAHYNFFDWLKDFFLAPNRIDHLFALVGEERHWDKTGKDKYVVGGSFDFDKIRDQIAKFHRKAQPKKLTKRYNV